MAFYHTVTEEQSRRQGGSCFWALLLHVDILGPEISSANSMRGSGKMTNFPAAQRHKIVLMTEPMDQYVMTSGQKKTMRTSLVSSIAR